ncbi:hypothetical protein [Lysinibacillus xylanilyticus]|uniref:Uncharacterized protein n=1 Tax=Lysinibacillus xylanilyticus TaxID=582475 RepID=A0ABT4ENR3_9BACI|nr:hypothetical protein [Lysinibacillus xylanilyticus]MCY9547302.1 hypothetical protein [Lysinibacillus xylanilyticus]
MNTNLKKTLFIFSTLIVTLIIVPVLFNFLFLWESGWSKGDTSDWFTLYGNIIGGLIGGFFTYLALLLTINDQKNSKKEDMRPRIDIPYQTIEFMDAGDEDYSKQIAIELNNVGGSLAKNIECSLSLVNLEETIAELNKVKNHLNVDIVNVTNVFNKKRGFNMVAQTEYGEHKAMGNIYTEYNSEFLGNCIPLVLNYEAKSIYLLKSNVSRWLNFIVKNRFYAEDYYNENETIDFNLEVKYSSEYGEFSDTFRLEWKHNGNWLEKDGQIKYIYLLKSSKV